MIRLMISVAFALAVATSAEAMSPAPLHEPDARVTHIADGQPCDLKNQVRIWSEGAMASASCAPLPLSANAATAGVWNGMKACVLSTTKTRLVRSLIPVQARWPLCR